MERSQVPLCLFTASLRVAHFPECPGSLSLSLQSLPQRRKLLLSICSWKHESFFPRITDACQPWESPGFQDRVLPREAELKEVFIVEEKFRHSGLCLGGFSVEMNGPSVCPCPSVNLCSVQQTESHTLRLSVSQLWRLCVVFVVQCVCVCDVWGGVRFVCVVTVCVSCVCCVRVVCVVGCVHGCFICCVAVPCPSIWGSLTQVFENFENWEIPAG